MSGSICSRYSCRLAFMSDSMAVANPLQVGNYERQYGCSRSIAGRRYTFCAAPFAPPKSRVMRLGCQSPTRLLRVKRNGGEKQERKRGKETKSAETLMCSPLIFGGRCELADINYAQMKRSRKGNQFITIAVVERQGNRVVFVVTALDPGHSLHRSSR
ncbi:hypothetical protein CEXT_10141 [Caerostris extrusa]|uniref:Uncharacterized protein n=1 Tax=Caerostris extrusa TaxID=172846 RepID=A0AAV4Y772_CAEEX|nr:hypothetical protein CEXT_10141 [Caerostris extrusa]